MRVAAILRRPEGADAFFWDERPSFDWPDQQSKTAARPVVRPRPLQPGAQMIAFPLDVHILYGKSRRMTDPAPSTDVIQGTLDMLILKALSLEPMHGFGIARRVQQISKGVFKVNPGSLLTALNRLERAGWLDAVALRSE